MEDFDNIIKLYADKIELLHSQIDELVEDSKTLELSRTVCETARQIQ